MDVPEAVVRNSPAYRDIGLIMGTHYEIIHLCLKNLPLETLVVCSAVCKSWNRVVKSIFKKRSKLRFHLLSEEPARRSKRAPKQLIREALMTCRGSHIPHGIGFGTNQLSTALIKFQKNEPNEELNTLHSVMETSLPLDCESIACIAEGLIGYNQENTIKLVFRPRRSAFAGATFPQTTGFTMHMFQVVPGEADDQVGASLTLFKNGDSQVVQTLKGALPGPVKCAIIFCNFNDSTFIIPECVCRITSSSQTESFALGGCIVKEVRVSNGDELYQNGGIFFCGDNLFAASIVISEEYSDEDLVKEKVLQLKACNFPLKNSFAFMFSCVGREDLKSETQIFQRHFPDTPLIGLVGNGEIGWNHLPKYGEANDDISALNKNIDSTEAIEHSYSSIIVLLSWLDK